MVKKKSSTRKQTIGRFNFYWLVVAGIFGMALAYGLAALGITPSSVELGPFSFDLPFVSRKVYQELEAENSYLASLIPDSQQAESNTQPASIDPKIIYDDLLHGKILFQDTFDNDRNQWNTGLRETNLVTWDTEVINSALRIDLSFHADATASINLPISDQKNFVLSFDTKIQDASLNDPTIIEIKFRIDGQGNLYSVRFSNNSTFAVRRCEAADGACNWIDVTDFIPSSYIKNGSGETNSFAIVILGSTFSIYSNDGRLITIQDSTLADPGGISIGVWGVKGNTAIVDFDNLVLSDTSLVESR